MTSSSSLWWNAVAQLNNFAGYRASAIICRWLSHSVFFLFSTIFMMYPLAFILIRISSFFFSGLQTGQLLMRESIFKILSWFYISFICSAHFCIIRLLYFMILICKLLFLFPFFNPLLHNTEFNNSIDLLPFPVLIYMSLCPPSW